MIEIVDAKPEEIKGTNARGNYHFFKQKAILHAVDRDGIEEVRAFSVVSNPGETYEPGDDYALSPDYRIARRTASGKLVAESLQRRAPQVSRVALSPGTRLTGCSSTMPRAQINGGWPRMPMQKWQT